MGFAHVMRAQHLNTIDPDQAFALGQCSGFKQSGCSSAPGKALLDVHGQASKHAVMLTPRST